MTAPIILAPLPERLRAVARQLDAVWRGVLAYGEQRAHSHGYTEADLERLVAASRREARDRT